MSNVKVTNNFKVYVAPVNQPTAGNWIEVTNVEQMTREIEKILLSISESNEFLIQDYLGFRGVEDVLGEYPNLKTIIAAVEFISEHGTLAAKLINRCRDVQTAIEKFENDYIGCYSTLGEFAEETNSDKDVPDWLAEFIDWESMGDAMEINGEIFTIETEYNKANGEINIFWNN